ncbi:MAG: hypothetical protein RMJ55_03225 [Roseiflexaceae bacterium]|nr:hypothetical protein [Roseiflexus sp.]MCS7290820.1 hypothetical protein [Roseiflexus sp.]MDW8212543.1 hypothetical protein [Roseiflexaceae bacterium]
MLRHIKRRGVAFIAGIGLALSIAACASQAKVQDQPLLNQLIAPNGFVIQQPATNQHDTNTTLPFDRIEQAPVAPGSSEQGTLDRVEQAPAAAPAGESQRAMDAKENTAVHMGCGK